MENRRSQSGPCGKERMPGGGGSLSVSSTLRVGTGIDSKANTEPKATDTDVRQRCRAKGGLRLAPMRMLFADKRVFRGILADCR